MTAPTNWAVWLFHRTPSHDGTRPIAFWRVAMDDVQLAQLETLDDSAANLRVHVCSWEAARSRTWGDIRNRRLEAEFPRAGADGEALTDVEIMAYWSRTGASGDLDLADLVDVREIANVLAG